jgi:hypothetical protein
MPARFKAQTVSETKLKADERRLEMTFVDAEGKRQVVSLPSIVASDLAAVLKSVSAEGNPKGRGEFTRKPRQTAIGSAAHERLVLIRFDDEPPYGLDPDEAESLWRGLREEAEAVSRAKAPTRQ